MSTVTKIGNNKKVIIADHILLSSSPWAAIPVVLETLSFSLPSVRMSPWRRRLERYLHRFSWRGRELRDKILGDEISPVLNLPLVEGTGGERIFIGRECLFHRGNGRRADYISPQSRLHLRTREILPSISFERMERRYVSLILDEVSFLLCNIHTLDYPVLWKNHGKCTKSLIFISS